MTLGNDREQQTEWTEFHAGKQNCGTKHFLKVKFWSLVAKSNCYLQLSNKNQN